VLLTICSPCEDETKLIFLHLAALALFRYLIPSLCPLLPGPFPTITLSSNDPPSPNLPTKPSATNGIVIATSKKSPSILIDDSALEKISIVCPNIGIVYSGMGPDFRVLIAKARQSAQAYWKVYNEYPPTKVLVQEIATIMQKATQSG
jgi:hypothetical protein